MNPTYSPQQPAYIPPPPPPVKRNGCLVGALSGCGLVAIVLVGLIAYFSNRLLKDPNTRQLLDNVTSAPQASEKLVKIRTALDAYRKQHENHYPARLADLLPRYLSDRAALTPDTPANHPPALVEYAAPPDGATPDTPLVSFRNSETESFVPGQRQVITVRLLLDGRIVLDTTTRQELSR